MSGDGRKARTTQAQALVVYDPDASAGQTLTFNCDAEFTGSWDTIMNARTTQVQALVVKSADGRKARTTQAQALVVYDPAAAPDEPIAAFNLDAVLRGEWTPPLTEISFTCDAEFTGSWAAPQPGASFFDCHAVFSGQWSKTAIDQLTSCNIDPTLTGKWEGLLGSTISFNCDAKFSGEWSLREDAVAGKCIGGDGDVEHEDNYAF